MATLYPRAEFDPLGPQTAPRLRTHDIVCLHTMAGTFDNTDGMFHERGYRGTESHFGVAGSGRLKQWQDLDFQADANGDGNHRCISIETADKGESFPQWAGSDVPDWTDAQIDVIVDLVGWLCETYDIPRALVPDSRPGHRGIAYHRLGVPHSTGDPDAPGGPWLVSGGELWTESVGKVCPGDRRIAQLKAIVIPRLQGRRMMRAPTTQSEEDDMFTFSTTGRPVYFVAAGKAVGLNELTDLEAIRTSVRPAPLPHFQLDEDTFNQFIKVFRDGGTSD